MPFTPASTIQANKRAQAAEIEVSHLWEYLIEEDQVRDAQDYIARQEGYLDYEDLIKSNQ